MDKRVTRSILFALLFVWQLPQNLVALAIMPFLGKLRMVTCRNYCIGLSGKRFPERAGGISLGNFAFFHPDTAHDEFTIRHEMDGHTVDSKIFGPLYLLVIGIPSILHIIFMKKGGRYYDFYTERWANKHAGIFQN